MTLLFCLVHGPMNSFILACLYLCAIIHVTCSDGTADKEEEGTTPYPVNPNQDDGDEGAKKVVTRVSIVLFVICVIGGLYLLWRCNKSRPNVRTKAGGNNYKRVRSTLPADDMGERGEDGDEETLYDRTESTSQF